jgi:hypothetical protein
MKRGDSDEVIRLAKKYEGMGFISTQYLSARFQIADLRQAAESIKELKGVSPKEREVLMRQFRQNIIKIAKATNSVGRLMQPK